MKDSHMVLALVVYRAIGVIEPARPGHHMVPRLVRVQLPGGAHLCSPVHAIVIVCARGA